MVGNECSVSITGLPAHSFVIAGATAYADNPNGAAEGSVKVEIGSDSRSSPMEGDPGTSVTSKHTGDSVTVKVTATSNDPDTGVYLDGLQVAVFAQAVTISGGGTLSEGNPSQTASFKVTREGTGDLLAEALQVSLDTGGTTASPSDYSGFGGGSVTIPAGESSKTVTLSVVDDASAEAPEGQAGVKEKLKLKVQDTGTYIAGPEQVTIDIADDSAYFYSPWKKILGPSTSPTAAQLVGTEQSEVPYDPENPTAPSVEFDTSIFYYDKFERYGGNPRSDSWGASVTSGDGMSTSTQTQVEVGANI